MTQKGSQVDDETRARVQAFYEEYPYPFIDRVEYDRGLISRLCYLAHSCLVRQDGGRPLRILIAGAGTREAVMWALSAPEHEIVAIDISERSLERTQVLAEQFKIDNLTTVHRSIESMSKYNGYFDLISSYGVLHHLPDPEVGLAALKAVLKPSGIMALMVYNHSNRQKLQQAQTLIARLSPKGSPLETREAIGLELCRFGAQRNSRMQHVFKNGLSDYAQSPQAFADAYLNPNERSYSVYEFSDYLGRHGMSLIGPVQPAHWEPVGSLPASVMPQYHQLSLLEKMDTVDMLQGPLMWVVAKPIERADERRPCETDDALFWARVPNPIRSGIWPISGQLTIGGDCQEIYAAYEPDGQDHVWVYRDNRHRRRFHKIALHLLSGIDGKKNLLTIATEAAAKEGVGLNDVKNTLKAYWIQLIDILDLAIIDTHQCAQCPFAIKR
ncbi:MAG: class I SAM-dependent methyltransferase [Bradymonadia bacterium]